MQRFFHTLKIHIFLTKLTRMVRLETAPTALAEKGMHLQKARVEICFPLHCKRISSKLIQQFNSAYEEKRLFSSWYFYDRFRERVGIRKSLLQKN